MSYTIGKYLQIRNQKFKFQIADANQCLLGTCFVAMEINRPGIFARVPHDNCEIAVIYMKLTENEEQVTWWFPCSFTDTAKYIFVATAWKHLFQKFQHFPVTSHHVFTQDRTISRSTRPSDAHNVVSHSENTHVLNPFSQIPSLTTKSMER